MSVTNRNLDLLLKEIKDPHVQENFYRLKLYIEELAIGTTNIIQNITNAGSVPGAVQLKKTMNCLASVAVNNWVYQSDATPNTAIAAADNNPAKPVIGVVVDKPSATQCEVMFLGIHSFVVTQGQLYLGTGGLASDAAPASGYIQKLGYSFGDGEILVRPEWTRILKT